MASDNHAGIDLAEIPLEEIRAHLKDYLGSPAEDEVDAATAAALTFIKMPDSRARDAALRGLGAFFCSHCGSGYLPCYCTRDD